MNFLNGMAVLLFYQLVGTAAVLFSDLQIPGPVLGMILLFVTLLIFNRVPEFLHMTSTHLLSHLSLLFVPAGVGVIAHLQRIESEWLPIVTTLFVSTLVSMAVTAGLMHQLVRLQQRRDRS